MVVLKNMLRKVSNIYNFIVFQKCPDFQNFANFFPKLVKSGIPVPFRPIELSVRVYQSPHEEVFKFDLLMKSSVNPCKV